MANSRWLRYRMFFHGAAFAAILACTSLTPHENFKRNLATKVGWNIDQIGGGWIRSDALMNTVQLPNGHIAYTYKHYVRSCQYTFEIDPRTRVVVATSWKGDEKDCYIMP